MNAVTNNAMFIYNWVWGECIYNMTASFPYSLIMQYFVANQVLNDICKRC